MVQSLDDVKVTRVACGSSHSIAWTTVEVQSPKRRDPVLFPVPRDPLGTLSLGNLKYYFSSFLKKNLIDHFRYFQICVAFRIYS